MTWSGAMEKYPGGCMSDDGTAELRNGAMLFSDSMGFGCFKSFVKCIFQRIVVLATFNIENAFHKW